jgi:hypothetical protein
MSMDVIEIGMEGRTLFEVFLGGSDHLEGNDLETSLLKAGYDGPNKVPLDAIRLDHDVSALVVGHGWKGAARGRTRERRKEIMIASVSPIA